MLIKPKKSLTEERQLKSMIRLSGKEFSLLHKEFDRIYKKSTK